MSSENNVSDSYYFHISPSMKVDKLLEALLHGGYDKFGVPLLGHSWAHKYTETAFIFSGFLATFHSGISLWYIYLQVVSI